MFFVLILSAVLFFMPPAWAADLSLNTRVPAHKLWLGLGMIVSGIYLVPYGVSPIVEGGVVKYAATRRIAQNMGRLAEDEKGFLRRFYFPHRVGRVMAWPHEIGKLESDGVLFRPEESVLKDKMQTYCLTDAASKYVTKHKTFLSELESVDPQAY
jgi:hypothetical protein